MNALFKDCPSNQTYRFKTIQNEILEICREIITKVLVGKIKRVKFFSVLADEATDCANIKQMAIVLRFVDSSFKIREEFIDFVPCQNGLSGEALVEKIFNFVKSIGLHMEDCCGQGYDGAGNIAGKYSGIATQIQTLHEKACHVHCNSHVLNICMASCCQIPLIRDMMDDVHSVSNVFNNSPKPALKKKINEIVPTAKCQKLLNVCPTRWISKIDGLQIFQNCYVAILAALDVISQDRPNDPNVRQRAGGMRKDVDKFEFILSLVLVEQCLK